VVRFFGAGPLRGVTLAVRDAGAEIELVAEDGAPAFDPFQRVPVPSGSVRGRAVGGLGRALVAGVSSRHCYERRGLRNRVTVGVLKHRGEAAPGPGCEKKSP
jgi:hypothetical protein